MATVTFDKLTKRYDNGFEAVKGIDLEIRDNEFMVFVGPSGCGKSTTLRMVAGLEDITDGALRIGERKVNDIAPGNRDIAMVFQNYALYPHMSVEENIAFGLKQRKMPKAEIRKAVDEAARILEIEALLPRKPRALSGGQRQRVAMGRAIVRNPQVFLFDEPLSNLDAQLRGQMRTEIKRLHQLVPTTTVYVTHDQIEAMTMADRVVVMNAGVIQQVGPPQELYKRPATRFVAGFIGAPSMNFIDVRVARTDTGPALILEQGGHRLPIADEKADAWMKHDGRKMVLGIRPEQVSHDGPGASVPGRVQVIEPMGIETLIYAEIGGAKCCARFGPEDEPATGSEVEFRFDMAKAHLIDPKSDLVVY
ncbi:ABC transporter ATP-binding protein [Pseudoroseicyclus sp. H15]